MATENHFFSYLPNVSWCIICNEVFVIDETSDAMYMFRNNEKEIWLAVGELGSFSCISQFMQMHFSVDKEKTINTIRKFKKNHLVGENVL